MKIRQGYVSNSSSSSFLLNDWAGDKIINEDDIKKYVYRVMKNYAKKYGYELTDKELDKSIIICKPEQIKEDLEYWHAPCDFMGAEYAIMDKYDNFIPDEVAKKIKKHFEVLSYHPHMG